MDYQNKNVKIVVGVIAVVLVIIFVIYNIKKSQQPVLLDKEYINSEMSIYDISIDELLLTVDVDDSNNIICLCSEADILHIIRFEKKNNSYEFLERYQINPLKLSENYTETIEFSKPFITASRNKYYIYTSVFINPKSETLIINGDLTSIKSIDVELDNKKYHIGVWAKAFLEKTDLDFG